MNHYDRIQGLASKINALLEAVERNQKQFTVIDKDMLTGYVRELYEAVLTLQPAHLHLKVTPLSKENESNEIHQDKNLIENGKKEKESQKLTAVIPELPHRENLNLIINGSEEKADQKPIAEKKITGNKGTVKTISERYSENSDNNKATLNEKYKSSGKIIADKLKQTPIKDLKSYIGLNKRFSFISVLFRGSEQQYEAAISSINSLGTYEEAMNFIRDEILTKYEWKDDEPVVAEFFNLIMRRYLN